MFTTHICSMCYCHSVVWVALLITRIVPYVCSVILLVDKGAYTYRVHSMLQQISSQAFVGWSDRSRASRIPVAMEGSSPSDDDITLLVADDFGAGAALPRTTHGSHIVPVASDANCGPTHASKFAGRTGEYGVAVMVSHGRCPERLWGLQNQAVHRRLEALQQDLPGVVLPEVGAGTVVHGVALVQWQFDAGAGLELVAETADWCGILREALREVMPMGPLGFILYHFRDVVAGSPTVIRDVRLDSIKWDSAVAEVLESMVPVDRAGFSTLGSVVSCWQREHGCQGKLMTYEVPFCIGRVLAHKRIVLDLLPVPQGGRMRGRKPLAGHFPSVWMIKQFRRELTEEVPAADVVAHSAVPSAASSVLPASSAGSQPSSMAISVHVEQNWERRQGQGGVRGFIYPVEVVMRALRASKHLRQQADLEDASADILDFVLPGDSRQLLETMVAVGFRTPSRDTLVKARIRLDWCAMLFHQIHCKCRDDSRCISFDKSPQIGREVFAVREEVLFGGVGARSRGSVRQRLLPLVCMGHGYLSAGDVAQALLHSACLDYGPSFSALKQWCESVRGVVTDDGTERLIADCGSPLGAMFSGVAAVGEAPGFLFPNAVRVPGFNHMFDVCVRKVIETHCPWFPAFEADLKTMSKFLGIRSYTDVLRQVLSDRGLDAYATLLSTSPASFAQWRWGTLVRCASGVLERRAALFEAFNPASFSTGSVLLERVKVLLSGDVVSVCFWSRVEFCTAWLCPLESFRQWCLGCPCHEVDRQAGRRVQCEWQGKRFVEVRRRLGLFLSEMSELASAASLHRTLAAQGWDHEFLVVCSQLAALVKLKLAFLDCLPYKVFFARDVVVMRECLGEYEEAVLAGRPVHRVTARFFDPVSLTSFRFQVNAFIATGRIPEALSRELAQYEWLPLDESSIEGVHRSVSCERRRGPAGKHPWNAASLRLEQNFELFDRLGSSRSGRGSWSWCWKRVKLVMHKGPTTMKVPNALRGMTFGEVSHAVYRLSADSYTDWGALQSLFRTPVLVAASRGEKQLLEIDYLRHVLRPSGMYSLPDPSCLREGLPEGLHLVEEESEHLGDICEQRFEGHLIFQVLDLRPLAHSLALDKSTISSFVFPALVQFFCKWVPGCRSTVMWEIFAHGEPCVVDLCDMCGWSAWRHALRCWELGGTADVQGCITIQNGAFVRWPGETALESLPTLLRLERLRLAGWQAGRGRGELHVLGKDDRTFYGGMSLAKRPSYLSCLLSLPGLFVGGFAELYPDQDEAYYRAVLKLEGGWRAHVRPNLRVTDYKELVRLFEVGDFDALTVVGRDKRPRLAPSEKPASPVAFADGADGGTSSSSSSSSSSSVFLLPGAPCVWVVCVCVFVCVETVARGAGMKMPPSTKSFLDYLGTGALGGLGFLRGGSGRGP